MAEVTLKPLIRIRRAVVSDSAFFKKLRNDATVVATSLSERKVEKEEHNEWFRKNRPGCVVIMLGSEKIGTISMSPDHYVSIYLLPKYRRMGFGSRALNILDWPRLRARVLSENFPSLKMFAKAGFKPLRVIVELERP